jgi:hypothetical protein
MRQQERTADHPGHCFNIGIRQANSGAASRERSSRNQITETGNIQRVRTDPLIDR